MTNYDIRTIDLPSFARHAIGFNRLFDEMNRSFANSRSDDKYPPYNIAKLDETHYVIELAVAGFSEEEIDIELKENSLTIKGNQPKKDQETDYIYKGISNRSFDRTFTLADNVEVRNATVQNGILTVTLEQVIPEAQKPKKIQITFQK
jgi:molecular chaperone IbpA